MPPESQPDSPPKIPSRWWLLALLLLIIIAFLFGPCQRVGEHQRGGEETPSPVLPRDTVRPGSITAPATESPAPLSPRFRERAAARADLPRLSVPPPDLTPRRVAGSVDSWEDWNASFSDTVTRTYSVIFDSARLDTAGGGVVFSPSGMTLDNLRVKQVECVVEKVRPFVKYTFPGEKVRFGIGVGFADAVSWRGALRPRPGTVRLEPLQPSGDRFVEEAVAARNQFIVVLNSPPGYAYTLRTAIECYVEGGAAKTRTYYTESAPVEFRRMIRFESLVRDGGDTIYLVTNNPAAVRDLAAAAPRSRVAAVLVPLRDASEGQSLLDERPANVALHVSAPRTLDRAFVVLSDSVALVEKNVLDPDFRRTAQLKLKGVQLQQVGLPRVTALLTDAGAVQELKLLYLHFSRLQP